MSSVQNVTLWKAKDSNYVLNVKNITLNPKENKKEKCAGTVLLKLHLVKGLKPSVILIQNFTQKQADEKEGRNNGEFKI